MKAMAMGAIPITSRFSRSGLVETCGDFDMGPFLDETATVQESRAHLQGIQHLHFHRPLFQARALARARHDI